MDVFVLTQSDATGKNGLLILISTHKTVEGAKTEALEWARKRSSGAVLEWYADGALAQKFFDESWAILGGFAERLEAAPVVAPKSKLSPPPYHYWSAHLNERWFYCIDQRELLD